MTGGEQRELGVLATKMAALERQFEEHREDTKEHREVMARDMKEIRSSLQSVIDKLNGWQGGWKAMVMMGAIASAVTTFALKFWPWHV